jgi:hypothetical protein
MSQHCVMWQQLTTPLFAANKNEKCCSTHKSSNNPKPERHIYRYYHDRLISERERERERDWSDMCVHGSINRCAPMPTSISFVCDSQMESSSKVYSPKVIRLTVCAE